MGYTRNVVNGIGWTGALRLLTKVAILAKVLVAYRLLSPADVGLFGLATLALGLLEMLMETGINLLLVKDERSLHYFLNTAFIVSAVRGIGISVLILISAFFLPSFFHEPRLQAMLFLAACIPVIRGFINPAVIRYQKELKFQKDAILRMIPVISEVALSIILVSLYPTPFSLIWSLLISAVIELSVSHIFVSPHPRFQFDRAVFHEIINPGKWLNVMSVLGYAEQNFDNVLVGRLLNTTALGYYQTAFNISRSSITEVGNTFAQVLLPVFGKIHGDKRRFIRAILFSALPLGLIMLLPAVMINIPFFQHYIILVIKDKWLPIFQLTPYLAAAAWFSGMNSVFYHILLVKDRLKSIVLLVGCNVICMLVFIWFLVHAYGLVGAAIGVLIAKVVIQPFFLWRTIHAVRSTE